MTASVSPDPVLEISSTPESSGPKCITTEALRRLSRSGYLALRDVSCDVHGENMRLSGRLPTHYLKQVAQAIVTEIDGVRKVDNLIEVNRSAASFEVKT